MMDSYHVDSSTEPFDSSVGGGSREQIYASASFLGESASGAAPPIYGGMPTLDDNNHQYGAIVQADPEATRYEAPDDAFNDNFADPTATSQYDVVTDVFPSSSIAYGALD